MEAYPRRATAPRRAFAQGLGEAKQEGRQEGQEERQEVQEGFLAVSTVADLPRVCFDRHGVYRTAAHRTVPYRSVFVLFLLE